MAKKSAETLEEGLNRSASKKGLTGKERHRYIGGTLRNMGKANKRHATTTPKAKTTTTHKTVTTHKTTTTRKRTASPAKPTPPKEKVSLTVKKNNTASRPGKNRYSIYDAKTGKQWNSSTYSKPSIADHERKIEQDAYNQGYKRGTFK